VESLELQRDLEILKKKDDILYRLAVYVGVSFWNVAGTNILDPEHSYEDDASYSKKKKDIQKKIKEHMEENIGLKDIL
jgi:ATP-dependent phosphoenolpyruvate carboxykinase